MPAFEWKDFFSVGHEAVDRQHQQLFAIVNELYDAMKLPGGVVDETLRKIIGALCDFTRSHFAEEEHLMRLAGYPDLTRHKLAHDYLAGRITEFETRMHDGETRPAAEVLPFLVGEWLTTHIAFEDQLYAGYLNSLAGSYRGRCLAQQEQYARQYGQAELDVIAA